jgi:signal transduction histidine kinase
MTGVEFIYTILHEIESKFYASVTDLPAKLAVQEALQIIRECIKNIQNTNSFMLMTINRCIDYTKASKGIKLVPKNETILLQEVLDLPLDCMTNIQEKIEIDLLPIGRDICSHIITDKQWLQENLLCLLSNAVKYSSRGIVTLKVELMQVYQDPIPKQPMSTGSVASFSKQPSS